MSICWNNQEDKSNSCKSKFRTSKAKLLNLKIHKRHASYKYWTSNNVITSFVTKTRFLNKTSNKLSANASNSRTFMSLLWSLSLIDKPTLITNDWENIDFKKMESNHSLFSSFFLLFLFFFLFSAILKMFFNENLIKFVGIQTLL